ncbi:MAG TPA: DUF2510 domain-containing protein [Ilumatobacteraceae bacterium]|nr:DUF2510 domain-containing protein [Ilumatobacteraceae bacterium]
MQEFESISASSYDPSALATKLTAKAAEGWSVVAIVPTGGDVTAFLTREKGGSAESTNPDDTSDVKDDKDDAAAAALLLPAKTEPAAEGKIEEVVEEKTEPVSEPSGWAIAPESSTTTPTATTPEPTGVQPSLAGTGAAAYGATTPAAEAVGATTAASTGAAAAAAATPAAAAAASAPAVPAGWYADPAGRFELRYWDGSTWTEHVSRAGQQFTDPPVA